MHTFVLGTMYCTLSALIIPLVMRYVALSRQGRAFTSLMNHQELYHITINTFRMLFNVNSHTNLQTERKMLTRAFCHLIRNRIQSWLREAYHVTIFHRSAIFAVTTSIDRKLATR